MTSPSLPDDATLESLKADAKVLLKQVRAGEAAALDITKRYFDDPQDLKLQQVQLIVAREHGFDSWRQLKAAAEAADDDRRIRMTIHERFGRSPERNPGDPIRNIDRPVHCSFCGKSQNEVAKLTAGPNNIYICNECVTLCVDILFEEVQPPPDSTGPEPGQGD